VAKIVPIPCKTVGLAIPQWKNYEGNLGRLGLLKPLGSIKSYIRL
jgi:hypothetical protein